MFSLGFVPRHGKRFKQKAILGGKSRRQWCLHQSLPGKWAANTAHFTTSHRSMTCQNLEPLPCRAGQQEALVLHLMWIFHRCMENSVNFENVRTDVAVNYRFQLKKGTDDKRFLPPIAGLAGWRPTVEQVGGRRTLPSPYKGSALERRGGGRSGHHLILEGQLVCVRKLVTLSGLDECNCVTRKCDEST